MPDLTPESSALVNQSQEPQSMICLGDLLDQIAELILFYTHLPHSTLAILIACWIANTYTYKAFPYCGYLTFRSATPRCGKSKLLRLIGLLSKNHPKPMTIPTAAVIFRSESKILLLDEVDNLRNRDKDLYGMILAVLNSGFEQGNTIARTEKVKGNFVVKDFDIYGPKALAGIESLADTLADRAFMIQMERAAQRMPRLHIWKIENDVKHLREQLSIWADQHTDALKTTYEQLPAELPDLAMYDDRFQDIAEPLVVLAKLADAERPDGRQVLPQLLESLYVVAKERVPSSRERGLLEFLDICDEHLGSDKTEVFVPSAELTVYCEGKDNLNWIDSPKKLAGFLKHFNLTPRQSPDGQCRGYLIQRSWVEKWKESYQDVGETTPRNIQGAIPPPQRVEVSETSSSYGDEALLEVSDGVGDLTH